MSDIVYEQCDECTSYEHITDDCPLFDRCANCCRREHTTPNCPLPAQIKCKNCYRANTVTKECDCQGSIFPRMQRLRLVGEPSCPIPLTDVSIYYQKYTALVLLGSRQTFVSPKVAADFDGCKNIKHIELYDNHHKRIALELHICIGKRLILHPCVIRESIAHDVVLGSDFLMKFGFEFRLGNIAVNNHSPRFSTYNEIQYWNKLVVVNGPQVQEEPARIVKLVNTTAKSTKPPGSEKRTVATDESEDEDVLDLHPSMNELSMMN